jgi:diguanylate cyclase (GGDEF)-like protein
MLSKLPLPLLVALQFILLGIGLFVTLPEGWSYLSAAVPPRASLILAHVLVLILVAWHLHRSRRQQVDRLTALNDQLAQALKRAEDVLECSSDLVWEVDMAGNFTMISDHNQVEGAPAGLTVDDLVALDPVTPREVWAQLRAGIARGEPFRDFQYSLPRSDGSIAHFMVNGVPIRDATGTLTGFRGTTRDRTVEVEALKALNFQALHDTLTGLPNRRSLARTLETMSAAASGRAAVLLLDLDGFKTVNDLHGHGAGDQLLRLVAARLGAGLRRHDVAARLGGDEFALILMEVEPEQAQEVARRLVKSIAAPYALEEAAHIRIGVSIGIALVPAHGREAEVLLRCADRALYQAKEAGGGAVQVYGAGEPAVQAVPAAAPIPALRDLRNLTALPGELQQALAQGELSLHFQPILRCADGQVSGVEALLRWNSPTRGAVPPAVFIPVAEESGLIVPIGAWVLRQACRAAAEAGGRWRLAVNISPVQFGQPELVPLVAGILRDTGLPPERLMLELTEELPLCRFPAAGEKMRKLRAMGIGVALDDFGAGYANLESLRDFRFDLLKVDRCVLALPAAQREAVLAALLATARAFATPVVVEGLEREEDWALVRRLGGEHAQGYHLGRPQPELAAALACLPQGVA